MERENAGLCDSQRLSKGLDFVDLIQGRWLVTELELQGWRWLLRRRWRLLLLRPFIAALLICGVHFFCFFSVLVAKVCSVGHEPVEHLVGDLQTFLIILLEIDVSNRF